MAYTFLKRDDCELSSESNNLDKKSDRYEKPSGKYAFLLRVREKQKRKKPEFARQESWRYKKVSPAWRRPKGIDSKMRLKKKGVPKSVEVGYGSPRLVRGFHPSGFEEILVNSLKDVEKVGSNQLIRVGHTVGSRKKLRIMEKAQELGLRVINVHGVGEVESTESKKTSV